MNYLFVSPHSDPAQTNKFNKVHVIIYHICHDIIYRKKYTSSSIKMRKEELVKNFHY